MNVQRNISKLIDLTKKLVEIADHMLCVYEVNCVLEEKDLKEFNRILNIRERLIKELKDSIDMKHLKEDKIHVLKNLNDELRNSEKELIEKLENIRDRILEELKVNSKSLNVMKRYASIFKIMDGKFNKEA